MKKMTVHLRHFVIISPIKNNTSFEQSLVIFTQIKFMTRLADMGQLVQWYILTSQGKGLRQGWLRSVPILYDVNSLLLTET